MHRAMRSDRFPRIFDYADAVRVEANSYTYKKGKNKGLKPLAERRRTNLTIRKVPSLTGEPKIAIQFYNTDIIVFRPNGEIVVDQSGWNTASSHEVIGRVLGTDVRFRNREGWIECAGGTTYPLRTNGENVFRRVENQWGYLGGAPALQYINPEYPTLNKLKRKEYNETRKKYKAFETYLFACLRVRGHAVPTDTECLEALGSGSYEPILLDKLMELVGNEDTWYQASLVILRRCRPRGWREELIKEARVKREIKDMICTQHRDELFYVEQVTTGKYVKDVNAKYFGKYALRLGSY